jgi:hypothetical protein
LMAGRQSSSHGVASGGWSPVSATAGYRDW